MAVPIRFMKNKKVWKSECCITSWFLMFLSRNKRSDDRIRWKSSVDDGWSRRFRSPSQVFLWLSRVRMRHGDTALSCKKVIEIWWFCEVCDGHSSIISKSSIGIKDLIIFKTHNMEHVKLFILSSKLSDLLLTVFFNIYLLQNQLFSLYNSIFVSTNFFLLFIPNKWNLIWTNCPLKL